MENRIAEARFLLQYNEFGRQHLETSIAWHRLIERGFDGHKPSTLPRLGEPLLPHADVLFRHAKSGIVAICGMPNSGKSGVCRELNSPDTGIVTQSPIVSNAYDIALRWNLFRELMIMHKNDTFAGYELFQRIIHAEIIFEYFRKAVGISHKPRVGVVPKSKLFDRINLIYTNAELGQLPSFADENGLVHGDIETRVTRLLQQLELRFTDLTYEDQALIWGVLPLLFPDFNFHQIIEEARKQDESQDIWERTIFVIDHTNMFRFEMALDQHAQDPRRKLTILEEDYTSTTIFQRALFMLRKTSGYYINQTSPTQHTKNIDRRCAELQREPMPDILIMTFVSPPISLAREGARRGPIMNETVINALWKQFLRGYYEFLTQHRLPMVVIGIDASGTPEQTEKKIKDAINKGQIVQGREPVFK